MIDAHRHLSMNVSSVHELLEELDSDGFKKTVLFGYNGMKFDGARHAQDQKVLEAFQTAPDRIIPFLCDFDFCDPDLEKYLSDNLGKGLFKGVGEILIGHSMIRELSFRNFTYFDDQVIQVFKLVSEFNVPILVHVDPQFIEDFTHALKECNTSQFIWAHAAYDFTTPFGGTEANPDDIESFLNRYDNLFFDISMYKISPVYLMNEKWLKLLEKYNDRFLFGTDMTSNYKNQSIWVKAYEAVFKKLGSRAVKMITEKNVLRLCNIQSFPEKEKSGSCK